MYGVGGGGAYFRMEICFPKIVVFNGHNVSRLHFSGA